MSQRGFACGKMLSQFLLLWALIGVGFGASWVLDLHGRSALMPPAVLLGCAVLAVTVLTLIETRRPRRED